MIVAVSRMLADNFETFHQLPASRMRVIHNGVDAERFAPANRDKHRDSTRRELGLRDEVLYLMLAHNLLLKNAETTIRAAGNLAANGRPLRVVIAGGKKPERFIKLSQKLGVASIVTFLSQVDPVPYYAAADVFVHPSWYDPCSLVTLEASSCGLPVITTRFNGAAEFITNKKEAFIVDNPADVTALADRMEKLLDPVLREKMGAAGRASALRYTIDDQTDQFVELYGEIVPAKQSRQI